MYYIYFSDLANSADPDEMSPFVAFYLGLLCVQRYTLRGFQSAKA